jgi:isopropylmalate/homocitrate/citramalate synthase
MRRAIRALREHRRDTLMTASPELSTDQTALSAHVEDKLHATKEAVQAKAKEVTQYLHEGSKTVQNKAEEATLQVRSAADEALAQLPTPVSGRVEQLAGIVRQRPVPAIAVLLGLLVLLALSRLRRGTS